MRNFVATMFLVALPCLAQEFKPYPAGRVTEEQWQSYLAQVKSNSSLSVEVVPAQALIVYSNPSTGAIYAFTQPGHPAHPAWIDRRVGFDASGGYVEMVGYFSGDEAAFAKLYQAYAELNAKMRAEFKRRSEDAKK